MRSWSLVNKYVIQINPVLEKLDTGFIYGLMGQKL